MLITEYTPQMHILAVHREELNLEQLPICDITTSSTVIIDNDNIVRDVVFSPDGKYLLTGSYDQTIREWDVATGQQIAKLNASAAVTSLALSPDGKSVVTGNYDATAHLWDLSTGQEIRQFTGHTKSINSVAYSLDGKHIVTASDDATIRIWDTSTGQETQIFTGHTDSVYSVAISPDSKLVISGGY